MMEDMIQTMLKISEELENPDISEQLHRLLDSLKYQHYYLTFMGQFSAGKSRLINRLLEKDVLPVHITETTALITLIQYDETDHADIFYQDGSQETVSIEESRELWQSGDTEKISEIAQLRICVNSELLRSGLIIADTPGVNTIINQHLKLTASVIENADRVMYVLGKSVTESDRTFIQSIFASGVPMIFVRTHMDEIKTTEENVELTCKKEKEFLEAFTEDTVFFVSSEENSPWYAKIEDLRNYLSSHITENLKEVLQKDIAARVSFLAERLKKILDERSHNLEKLMTGKESEFLAHKKEMEDSLQHMEDILKRNRESLQKKYENIRQSANEELIDAQNAEIKKVKEKISQMKYGFSPESYVQPVENAVKTSCQYIYINYLSTFDRMLKENKEMLNRELSDFDIFSHMKVELPETLQESEEMSEDFASRLESLQALQESLKEELASISEQQQEANSNKEQLLQEQEEMRTALQSIQNELDSYPEYVPKYYEKEGSHKHEENFRKVGKILDFATLFIPGEGWAKIGAGALKAVSKGAGIVKATSVAKKLAHTAKVLQGSAEVAKLAKFADTTMDVTRVLNKYVHSSGRRKKKIARESVNAYVKGQQFQQAASTARQQIEDSETPGLLDLLSIDYHFAKIGKKLDKPSVKMIDTQYEQEYYAGKREIEQRKAKQTEAEFKKRMQIIGVTDKQTELQLREEAAKRSQQSAEREILDLQAKIQKKREKSRMQYLISYYQDAAEEKIKTFVDYLKTTIQPDTEKKINDYLHTYDFRVLTDIHRKQAELSALEKEFHSMDRQQQEETAKKYQAYLKFLSQFPCKGELK